jgi:iron(III) transport system permease protein
MNRLAKIAVLVALSLILWGYIVGPLVGTFQRSITGATPFSDYIRFFDFRSGVQGEAMLGSLMISVLSVITSGIVGVFLAVILQRWDFPLRRFCQTLVLVPIALPPLMGVAALVKLYGLGGTFPQLLGDFFGTDPNAYAIEGLAGVLLVHTLTMYPYFYLSVSAALEQSDDSLEEAAYSLGASTFQTWNRVILPMLTPAIVSGALLTFMSAMTSYTAPLLFNVDYVMTRQIMSADANAEMAFSSVVAVMLAAVSIVFLILLRRWEEQTAYRTQSKGGGRKRQSVTNPAMKALILGVSLVSTVFLILPIAMIFVLAFSVDGSWRTAALPSEYTTRNIVKLFTDSATWAPIQNSLVMSAIACCGAILLGVSCAYVLGRMSFRGKTAFDIAIMLPFALPGTVVAFNLIKTFNVPSVFSFGQVLVGTYAIVPLAYFVRFSPLVFRSTTASLSQLDPSVEEAARSLGSSWLYTFRRITLPLLYPGIAAGALLAFVNGIGEFVATILLHVHPRYRPLSIAIFDEFYRGNFGTAAAWGVVQVVLVLLVVIATQRIQRQGAIMKL